MNISNKLKNFYASKGSGSFLKDFWFLPSADWFPNWPKWDEILDPIAWWNACIDRITNSRMYRHFLFYVITALTVIVFLRCLLPLLMFGASFTPAGRAAVMTRAAMGPMDAKLLRAKKGPKKESKGKEKGEPKREEGKPKNPLEAVLGEESKALEHRHRSRSRTRRQRRESVPPPVVRVPLIELPFRSPSLEAKSFQPTPNLPSARPLLPRPPQPRPAPPPFPAPVLWQPARNLWAQLRAGLGMSPIPPEGRQRPRPSTQLPNPPIQLSPAQPRTSLELETAFGWRDRTPGTTLVAQRDRSLALSTPAPGGRRFLVAPPETSMLDPPLNTFHRAPPASKIKWRAHDVGAGAPAHYTALATDAERLDYLQDRGFIVNVVDLE